MYPFFAPITTQLKKEESYFLNKLLEAGMVEVKGPLYPTENNFIYEGLRKEGLLECVSFHSLI